jgi:hypothetical protein
MEVLNTWWPHMNESGLEGVQRALAQAGVKEGETLSLHRLAMVRSAVG